MGQKYRIKFYYSGDDERVRRDMNLGLIMLDMDVEYDTMPAISGSMIIGIGDQEYDIVKQVLRIRDGGIMDYELYLVEYKRGGLFGYDDLLSI